MRLEDPVTHGNLLNLFTLPKLKNNANKINSKRGNFSKQSTFVETTIKDATGKRKTKVISVPI